MFQISLSAVASQISALYYSIKLFFQCVAAALLLPPPAPPPQKTNAIVADAGFVNLVIVSDLIKRASLSF